MDIWNGNLPEPEVRTVEDMRGLLAYPRCEVSGPLYYMYRNLALSEEDRVLLVHAKIRYDITMITAGSVCGEFIKTKGHYHPENEMGVPYPEVYEVLSGRGHFLLQSVDLNTIILHPASAGDKVLIPPGFGHVTINPGNGPLVMANIVSDTFSSDYAFFEAYRGAAYYETDDGLFQKNPLYKRVADLRIHEAVDHPEIGIVRETPLYHLIGDPVIGEVMNHPERFTEIWEQCLRD
ncbi:MAG: glucose-6-phosphate isomerase family protein [Methanocalculus sp.]|uniref:glucose-6-phosphate isomerase family protein n=1 Tax=Methanocalculus sp. TaxID=2004547 RepID=UPI00271AA07C|nr:glucose-6-phosphate isomerase family protein [Methanocalculus sp.]MDO8841977.1 glucose-6-phosphate isomerase family protein [Methanocalculus sp.]MDO9539214.1 glucose-6-phosphate isomerase family protein [Methanocalculus sp.]